MNRFSSTRPAPAGLFLGPFLCLLLAIPLAGCLETLEAISEIADENSEDEQGNLREECDPAPASCRRDRPQEARLYINVSGGAQEITVYRGDFENGRVVWSGSASGSTSVRLPLGTYSATASYMRGGKTVVAVDGDYLDYSSTETCDGTCYDEVDGHVDLELEK